MAVNIDVKVIIDAVNNASKQFTDVAKSMGGMTDGVKEAGLAMAGLGVATVGAGIQFVQQAGQFEQYQIALTTMLGSADKARTMLSRLTEEAKATPFRLEEVVVASKQLLAMGSTADQVIPQMRMLGDVSAGLGVPLQRLILNFGQVQTRGKLAGTELKDFAVAGVPLIDELAKVLGVAKDQVTDLVSDGKVGFAEVTKAFQNMTGEGGKFHNLMASQADSTLGKWSNLQDSVQQMSVALGKVLLPSVTKLIDSLIPMVDKLSEFGTKNPQILTGVLALGAGIGALGIVITALGPVVKVVTGLFNMFRIAGTALSAVGSFIGSMASGIVAVLGGPLTIALIAGIALITGLALAWKNNWFDIQGKTRAAVEGIKTFLEGLKLGIINFVTEAKMNFDLFVAMISTIPGMIAQKFNELMAGLGAVATSIGTFFVNLGASIMAFIAATPQMLYNLFVVQIPMALGFMYQSFINLFTIQIPAIWNAFIAFMTVSVPQFANSVKLWFFDMVETIRLSIIDFATVQVPNAFNAMISYISTAVPAMANSVKNWFVDMVTNAIASATKLKNDVVAALIALKNQAIATVTALYNDFVNWITKTVTDSTKAINDLPGNVATAMDTVKNVAIDKAKQIYEGVKEWFDKIKNFFQDIINMAGEAISKATSAFNVGRSNAGRQFGGPVSSATPMLVGENGPEIFTPSVAGHITPNNQISASKSGQPIQFIINSNMIINSPSERRSLAEALYTDLLIMARAQNRTVAEMMGG